MADRVRATAARLKAPTLLVARLLLAGLFLHEAAVLAGDPDGALAALARAGVPAPLAVATAALQLAAGAGLALGLATRAAAVALGVFCVATATLFHTRLGIRNELLHFEKDLAIAGGLFALACQGAGAWSLDAWLRCDGKSKK